MSTETLIPTNGPIAELAGFFKDTTAELEYADDYRMLYKQTNLKSVVEHPDGRMHFFLAYRKVEDAVELYGFVVTGERTRDAALSGSWTPGADGRITLNTKLHNAKALTPRQWSDLRTGISHAIFNSKLARHQDLTKVEKELFKSGAKELRGFSPTVNAAMAIVDSLNGVSPYDVWPTLMTDLKDLTPTQEEIRLGGVVIALAHAAKKARKKGR